MIYKSQAAFDFLALESVRDDPNASSHWKAQHSGFRFLGNSFVGLRGFGGHQTKLEC